MRAARLSPKKVLARRRSRGERKNPAAREVYRAFHRRDPKRLTEFALPQGEPFIYIGPVPELHYVSDKEGRRHHYFHKPGKPPILYYHPTKPVGLLIGGSMKLGDWFYG